MGRVYPYSPSDSGKTLEEPSVIHPFQASLALRIKKKKWIRRVHYKGKNTDKEPLAVKLPYTAVSIILNVKEKKTVKKK